MLITTIYNMTGEKVGEMELEQSIFGIKPNISVMHAAVVNYLANQRQGTQSTLTRGEVRGGGRKPYKNNKIDRSRAGSIRMPHWTHGGIAHGPKPRDYSYHINKKARQLAIKSALSSKVLENGLIVVDSIELKTYRTKSIIAMLKALNVEGKALIVMPVSNKIVYKSASNIPGVMTTIANSLNTYDLLNYDKCVIAKEAVSIITGIYATNHTAQEISG